MEPITAISTALTGIKTATEITKYFKSIDGQFEEAEYKLKIIDVMDALIDAKSAILEFKEIIQEKDNRIRELNEKLSEKQNVELDGLFYYSVKDEAHIQPFCSVCYGKDGNLIPLTKEKSNGSRMIRHCHGCNQNFETGTNKDWKPINRITRNAW